MRILFVRHSESVAGGDGLDDAARYLSQQGRITARRVAMTLRAQKLEPSSFVTSPRVRAVQTAEIFAHALGFEGLIESMPSLCYTVSPQVAARELSHRSGTLLAFGHMPTLPEIAKLLGATRGPGGFAPSEALLIEDGRALWSIDPHSLAVTPR